MKNLNSHFSLALLLMLAAMLYLHSFDLIAAEKINNDQTTDEDPLVEKAPTEEIPAEETPVADAPVENATQEKASSETDTAETAKAAEAPQSEDKQEAYKMEEIVSTASRDEEVPFLSNRSLDVISTEELNQRQPRTVPEALRESPGVFVQQTNFGGGSPIIRGFVGPQILILVDGIRLNNSVFRTGPLQYLNLIDPYEIKRLEVVRGPGSVLYGSDAIGATINAITSDPNDYRSSGEFGYAGRVAGKYGSAARETTGHADLDLGYSLFGSRFSVTVKNFDDLQGGRGVGRQAYTSYNQVNASGKVTTRLSKGFVEDWTFSLGYHLALMNDVGRAEKLDISHKYDVYENDHHLVYGRADMKFKQIYTNLELTLSYQRFFEEKMTYHMNESHSITVKQTRDRISVDSLGVEGKFTTKVLSNRLRMIYGSEFSHDWVGSSRIEKDTVSDWHDGDRSPYPEGSAYYLVGAYLHAIGELLDNDSDFGLRLSAGYRFQEMGGSADARTDAPAVDYGNRAHVFSAGIEGSYKRHWMSAFTFSQGFRAPNLMESVLSGDTGDYYHVANSDLGPERSNTLELLNRFKFWRLDGSLTGYVSFISDAIKRVGSEYEGQTVINGNNVVENANGGNGRLYGAESRLGINIYKGLSLNVSITYTYGSELLDDVAQAADTQSRSEIALSRIPPLFGDAKLRWEGEFNEEVLVFVETWLQFAAKQDRLSDRDKDDIRIPEGGTPGWVTWNMRSGIDYNNMLRAVLSIENLTNTKYKYHGSGVYGAGTNAIMSLEISY